EAPVEHAAGVVDLAVPQEVDRGSRHGSSVANSPAGPDTPAWGLGHQGLPGARVRRMVESSSEPSTIQETHMSPPAPGSYTIDASHTEVGFTVRHAGISKVRGQ